MLRFYHFVLLTLFSKMINSQYLINNVAGTGSAVSNGDGNQATSAGLFTPKQAVQDFLSSIVYLTEYDGHKIRRIAPDGIISTHVGTGAASTIGSDVNGDEGQATSATLHGPFGLFLDMNGTLYFTDQESFKVRIVSVEGIITTYLGTGVSSSTGDGGPLTSATVSSPASVWGDTVNNIYISDGNANNIRKVDVVTLLLSTFAGTGTAGFNSNNIPATSSHFNKPRQVFGDTTGVIYAADFGNNRIRKISNGLMVEFIGSNAKNSQGDNGLASMANIDEPRGVCVDADGYIFASEYGGNRMRVVDPVSGIITRVAGTGAVGASGDGGPALQAKLGDKLMYVTPALYNVVYVGDHGNNKVRKLYYDTPTSHPSSQPSRQPTAQPSSLPSAQPTEQPNSKPSSTPTQQPSSLPSAQPIAIPSMQPSVQPTDTPTMQPSTEPSCQPSSQPSAVPTVQPSEQPTQQPSQQPSCQPSFQSVAMPSSTPSAQPTNQPSETPSARPSANPTQQPSSIPSSQPSTQPSAYPSTQPTTQPSASPSQSSSQPSNNPTSQPSRQPTCVPTFPLSYQLANRSPTGRPSGIPSGQPANVPSSVPSSQPSGEPSVQPAGEPTAVPSHQPFSMPTSEPSMQPSGIPTNQPSDEPSTLPSTTPSTQPSGTPSSQPLIEPSSQPSSRPSVQPSEDPSAQPLAAPSAQPSVRPSVQPSEEPSAQPLAAPSAQPSVRPSGQPSGYPSGQPSSDPTTQPSVVPSTLPSVRPSSQPTAQPSLRPGSTPTAQPSSNPSSRPSAQPSRQPTTQPTGNPTSRPSTTPTEQPLAQPSARPSGKPSCFPTVQPTAQPTSRPTHRPLTQPSGQPSVRPTMQPTSSPTSQPSNQPTGTPARQPTAQPTAQPSLRPLLHPTAKPTGICITCPPVQTAAPSAVPTAAPTPLPVVSVIGTNETFRIILPFLRVSTNTDARLHNVNISEVQTFGTNYIVYGGQQHFNSLDLSTLMPPVAGYSQSPAISYDFSGRSVANAGDINGDGHTDLIIGVPYASRVYVLFGTKHGFVNMTRGFTVFGAASFDMTGWSVSSAGDVNNDTFADMIIGAPLASHGKAHAAGAAYVIFGRSGEYFSDINLSEWDETQGFVIRGSNYQDNLGLSVSGAGDVNGDGFDDVIVGALRANSLFSGAAHIVYGNSTFAQADTQIILSSQNVGITITGPAWSWFGYSVSGAGDVNGDGRGDVIVGSVPHRTVFTTQISYILYGSATPSTETTTLASLLSSTNKTTVLVGGGVFVGDVSDVNDDGLSDVLVGCDYGFDSGAGFVVHLSQSALRRNVFIPLTVAPTALPTTSAPSVLPTIVPTTVPSVIPTLTPSATPSARPTAPTQTPTVAPSGPTLKPTVMPSQPTVTPTHSPSVRPTLVPSATPSVAPSTPPTTLMPTNKPTETPIASPTTAKPTVLPTLVPTVIATAKPTNYLRASRSPSVGYPLLPVPPTRLPTAIPQQNVRISTAGNYSRHAQQPTRYIINAADTVVMTDVSSGLGDTFVITPNSATTLIVVIHHFSNTTDVIDLTLFPSLRSLGDFNITCDSVAMVVVISLSGGQIVRLLNYAPGDITEANFIFHNNDVRDDSQSETSGGNQVIFITGVTVAGVFVLALCYLAYTHASEWLGERATHSGASATATIVLTDADDIVRRSVVVITRRNPATLGPSSRSRRSRQQAYDVGGYGGYEDGERSSDSDSDGSLCTNDDDVEDVKSDSELSASENGQSHLRVVSTRNTSRNRSIDSRFYGSGGLFGGEEKEKEKEDEDNNSSNSSSNSSLRDYVDPSGELYGGADSEQSSVSYGDVLAYRTTIAEAITGTDTDRSRRRIPSSEDWFSDPSSHSGGGDDDANEANATFSGDVGLDSDSGLDSLLLRTAMLSASNTARLKQQEDFRARILSGK